MKKLTVIFLTVIFVFTSASAFAKTWKIEKPEDSVFNCFKNWISSFGERADGVKVVGIEDKPSWLTADEIKERRRSIGVTRGMGEYE